MFPSQFDYHRPSSVAEAIQILGEDPEAKILAGGHSLLPAMKLRLAAPTALVDLSQIGEMRGIAANGDITIGAMTTYNELLDHSALHKALPVIAETAHHVGDAQVRSRGTLGGSLAHSDPAADYTAVMLALGAHMTAEGPNGERTISADEFFVDIFTTALEPHELLTKITIPSASGQLGVAYEKQEHPASGYAIVGIAAALSVEGGSCSSARIAVTGCTPKATRSTAAESALVGSSLDEAAIADAASRIAEGLDIIGETYASADYRRHLLSVLGRRVLAKAAERAT